MNKFHFLLLLSTMISISCTENEQGLTWIEDPAGYRYAFLNIEGVTTVGFKEVVPHFSQINFENRLTSQDILQNRHYMHGSGVSIGDVNNDGWDDIYLCKMNGKNALYINEGAWKFRDVADDALVSCPNQYSTGSTLVDIDGDKDLDLIVTSMGGPVSLFHNNGEGVFTKNNLSKGFGATTPTIADIDRDGDLDLYITNYKNKSLKDSLPPDQISFDKVILSDGDDAYKISSEFESHYDWERRGDFILQLELGESDKLYINDGAGNLTLPQNNQHYFIDNKGDSIQSLPLDWGLVAQFRDINNDGWPDLYVCNDFESPDYYFINKNGIFHESNNFNIRHTSNSSMSVDFADLNQDGNFDFFVSDMLSRSHQLRKTQMGTMSPTPLSIGVYDNRPQYMRNTLFISREDNTFIELAQYAGVQASEWSWSAQFLDVDLDGLEDLLITTGHLYDVQDSDANEEEKRKYKSSPSFEAYRKLIFNYPRLNLNNIAFKNLGNGKFETVEHGWGIGVEKDVSHGMAVGDLDNDGDLDVVINRMNTNVGIFENTATADRVAIRLIGSNANSQGIGSKLKLIQDNKVQLREVTAGGKYLSSNSTLQVFGVSPNSVISLEIIWPNQMKSILTDLKPNTLYEIDQSKIALLEVPTSRDSTTPFYELANQSLIHHEDPFNDFSLQSLLPNRISQLGPGISAFDFDDDGFESIWLPSGKGGFLQSAQMKENKWTKKKHQPTDRDQNEVLGIHDSNGKPVLVLVYNGLEVNENSKLTFLRQNESQYTLQLPIPMVGMISSADVDNDGDLDLFVCGRTIPGQYPKAASSLILIQENGLWKIDQKRSDVFKQIGLVTGSCFSDINNDNHPDIILSLEWGSPMLFLNQNGFFSNHTNEFGLSDHEGWWNSVSTADVNGDGLMDLLMANWGENTKYHMTDAHPIQVLYGDFDDNNVLDIVEAHFDNEFNELVPERGFSCMSNAMPFIKDEKRTFTRYASSGLKEIFGDRLTQADSLKVNTLQSGIFLNEGKRFRFKPLPQEVQYTTAMHIGVIDYNADGKEDLVISQNFFAVQIETDRNDAGRGLLLQGNGTGSFVPVNGTESGLKVYGEQRGVCIGDFNQDNKPDLAIAQNGAELQIFTSTYPKECIAIKLNFKKENPSAIGAKLRWIYPNEIKGPVREIKAGHGYWSQDSFQQLMGTSENPKSLEITWPDGRVQKTPYEGEAYLNISYAPI